MQNINHPYISSIQNKMNATIYYLVIVYFIWTIQINLLLPKYEALISLSFILFTVYFLDKLFQWKLTNFQFSLGLITHQIILILSIILYFNYSIEAMKEFFH